MLDWHDFSCRSLDVFTSGGISSCLSCGSVQPGPGPFLPNGECNHRSIYQALENATDMRLLTLEPGVYDDPVRGSLHLTTTSGFVKYDAISYAWAGEDESMERSGVITLNTQIFPVTPNCEAALRRARSWSGLKTIWIDAICINQEDLRERGHQVRLMQQIYSRADHVLIYIGEPTPEEDKLLVFISGPDEVSSSDRNLLQQQQITLCGLLQRRYFSRVWVLQEVALARQAILICGKHSIPWSLMASQRLHHMGLLERTKKQVRSGLSKRTNESVYHLSGLNQLPPVLDFRAPVYRDPGELLELLEATRGSRASDPRDKVFALLGLLTCPDSEGLVADYTKTTAEVYTFIAIWIAQRFGLPRLLSNTYVPRQRPPAEKQGAQWVPNWTDNDLRKLESLDPPNIPTARLPIAVCELDTTAIRFPAFLLGTAAQVLGYNEHKPTLQLFYSDHKLLEVTRRRDTTDPFSPLEGRKLENGSSRILYLNYRSSTQKTTGGKACGPYHLGVSGTIDDSPQVHEWTKHLVYLIPEPHPDGFRFTEPGLVSVSTKQQLKTWTHKNNQGKKTTGLFSAYAVCCSESREGGDDRVYLRGLFEHQATDSPKPGNFEFVSAK